MLQLFMSHGICALFFPDISMAAYTYGYRLSPMTDEAISRLVANVIELVKFPPTESWFTSGEYVRCVSSRLESASQWAPNLGSMEKQTERSLQCNWPESSLSGLESIPGSNQGSQGGTPHGQQDSGSICVLPRWNTEPNTPSGSLAHYDLGSSRIWQTLPPCIFEPLDNNGLCLSYSVFHKISNQWGHPDLDLMVSPVNKCKYFLARVTFPEA